MLIQILIQIQTIPLQSISNQNQSTIRLTFASRQIENEEKMRAMNEKLNEKLNDIFFI